MIGPNLTKLTPTITHSATTQPTPPVTDLATTQPTAAITKENASEAPFPLLQLPIDVLTQVILPKLEPLEIMRLSLVSKSAKTIAKHNRVWQEMIKKYFPYYEKVNGERVFKSGKLFNKFKLEAKKYIKTLKGHELRLSPQPQTDYVADYFINSGSFSSLQPLQQNIINIVVHGKTQLLKTLDPTLFSLIEELACKIGQAEVLQKLYEVAKERKIKTKRNILTAASSGYLSCVKTILMFKSTVNIKSVIGVVLAKGKNEITEYLDDKISDLSDIEGYYDFPELFEEIIPKLIEYQFYGFLSYIFELFSDEMELINAYHIDGEIEFTNMAKEWMEESLPQYLQMATDKKDSKMFHFLIRKSEDTFIKEDVLAAYIKKTIHLQNSLAMQCVLEANVLDTDQLRSALIKATANKDCAMIGVLATKLGVPAKGENSSELDKWLDCFIKSLGFKNIEEMIAAYPPVNQNKPVEEQAKKRRGFQKSLWNFIEAAQDLEQQASKVDETDRAMAAAALEASRPMLILNRLKDNKFQAQEKDDGNIVKNIAISDKQENYDKLAPPHKS